MIDDETKYSIEEIIYFCRTCEIQIVSRERTKAFLTKAGKDISDVKEEIRQLKEVSACADPELDYGEGRKGYVYQFKKVVFDRYWGYIKIKIKLGKDKVVWVLSFHEEEFDYEIKRTQV